MQKVLKSTHQITAEERKVFIEGLSNLRISGNTLRSGLVLGTEIPNGRGDLVSRKHGYANCRLTNV
jgi:hypothetical protein